MPNKQYQKALRQLKAGVIATRQVYAADRRNEYRQTTDVVGGIYSNLGTTVAGVGRRLTAGHTRNLQALARLADRTHSGNAASIAGGRAEARNLFGSAVQGLTAPVFEQASGHAAGADIALAGAARAGITTAKGGQTILGILKAGVQEARAGAKAQTADALMYRAKEDAKLIAAQQNMILQSKLDFQNWKRQQDYLQKLEEADTTGQLTGVRNVADLTVSASITMQRYLLDNPDATVDELVSQVTQGNSVLAGDPNALVVLSQLAARVQDNTGDDGKALTTTYAETADAILDSVLLLYPNYKNVPKLKSIIEAGLRAGWNAATVAAQAAADAQDEAGVGGSIGGGFRGLGGDVSPL